ncbi:MAG: transcriptional regulator [Planctomycetaceae bacterium]
MNDRTRLPESQQNDLPREIIDLARYIAALPADLQVDLEGAYNRVVDSVRRRRRILTLVQEALSQLRLDIKYLMFDLEATRRERDELREQHGEFE